MLWLRFCFFLTFLCIVNAKLLFKPVITHGDSILTCNTVKCRGGHKCIMTKYECSLPYTSDPFAPTNCESRPKCVPDKICKACGPNEHRSRCSVCDRTCKDPTREQCKKKNICGQSSRCVCDSGFVRDKSGKCVKYETCPNVPKKSTTTSTTTTTPSPTPEDFIIISKKEKKQRHEQIDLLKPTSTKKPNNNNSPDGTKKPNRPGKPETPQGNPDDGFIVVKEKQNNQKPDKNNPKNPTSNPDKPNPKDKDDDGFIIVKGKNPKRPSGDSQNPTTKTPDTNDDGFIVVHEKLKNHREPNPTNYNNDNDGDKEFFVSKKKVQNGKHEQINLM